MYMLDTDTCSYILRERPESVHRRFRALARSEIAVSAIVAAELYYGARRHPTRSDAIRSDIVDFLSRLVVLPWRAEEHYAQIRFVLESQGRTIGNNDLLIGAHAIAAGATLVTNNLAHFERIDHLRCESWV